MSTRISRSTTQTVMRVPRVLIVLVILLTFVCVGALFTAWNFYSQTTKTQLSFRANDKLMIIENIRKHVLLPTDEDPVFATVTDPAKLVGQPFFEQAITGDRVLVYSKANKAILYRPSVDRIIEMMPINLTEPPTP